MNFDVLIPAHGESINQVEFLLKLIMVQKTPKFKLDNIILCSDNEALINFFNDFSLLTLIPQEPNCGKPDAFNRMLKEASSDICIQNSADCIPASRFTYKFLLNPLNDDMVGAVTSHPIPSNYGFMYLPNIVWKVHSFVQPKLSGESFSFKKKSVKPIPLDVIHDDAYIHSMIISNGFKVLYEPRAIVYNAVPTKLSEFYRQRKKNVIGNMQLGDYFKVQPPKLMRLRSLILMSLELLANVHGRLDYVRGHVPKGLVGYNLETTKEVIK